MTITVIEPSTIATVGAAATQDAQRAALISYWAGGNVTVRHMAGAVVAETCVHGTWELDAAVPRGMTLGPLISSTVAVSGATITSMVYAAGSVAIFSDPISDVTLGSPTTLTGRRTNLGDLVRPRVRITALSTLPLATTYALTFSVDVAGTVAVDAAGSIVNTGTGACTWSITPPSGIAVSPNSGTLAAGATQALTITPSAAATYSLTLVSAGAAITGSPKTIVVAAAPASAFTLTGLTAGATGAATTFTITTDGPLAAACTVSIAAPGATLSTASLSFAAGAVAPQTFTVTRSTDGTTSVSITNSLGLTNSGSPISYTSSAAWSATIALTVSALPSSLSSAGFALLASGARSLDFYGGFVGHQGSVYMPSRRAVWNFGAETHSDANYYTNSPRHIALDTMTVYRDQADSATPGQYRLDNAGMPFADSAKTCPWGQHALRQMVRTSADEFLLAYPTTEHANYFGVTPPIYEGAVTSVSAYRRALWYYNTATGAWRYDDGGASNANIAGVLDGAVGYGIIYHSARGSIMGAVNGYWRELNLSTYARESSAPVIGGSGYNTYAMLLSDGTVLCAAGGSSANTTLCAIVNPASPGAFTTISKASVSALSSYSAINTPWAILPSGRVLLFAKDQTANTLRAFVFDPALASWTDTGHTLSVGAVGAADGTYWQQCDYADDFGIVVLTSNINSTLSVWAYKPAAGV